MAFKHYHKYKLQKAVCNKSLEKQTTLYTHTTFYIPTSTTEKYTNILHITLHFGKNMYQGSMWHCDMSLVSILKVYKIENQIAWKVGLGRAYSFYLSLLFLTSSLFELKKFPFKTSLSKQIAISTIFYVKNHFKQFDKTFASFLKICKLEVFKIHGLIH